uniref:Uncharacterized protein n=1 Tax=Plectus sambesii TaxID=2011161 RepID=A0A914WER4_9BILA
MSGARARNSWRRFAVRWRGTGHGGGGAFIVVLMHPSTDGPRCSNHLSQPPRSSVARCFLAHHTIRSAEFSAGSIAVGVGRALGVWFVFLVRRLIDC